ncbi:endonuclease IV [Paenibacillus darwinianus]|uniref:Endonuclease IV n=1 Tax=Paenibacillus darwinianus TaxID=1380763 RepID=A0A9W5S265_9BACL|nr:deoxyribonuclease IV [Paenibacillus darwinianus]EXX89898.1 endonuclease IV [Paenibacillus darwinianus]EXX90346.1 endonuclease IV [Paenibacillus darwinianus]EXX90736.1 endonuclease IV [Paenibacillus darwinianus]
MRIGSHVSIRRGFREAAAHAHSLGGGAYQYFPKNPRSLGVKAFDRQDAQRCADYCREHGLVSIAHSPYPVNLAADDAPQRERIAASLLNDLDIADSCGSLGIVVHFGIYKGNDVLQGYRNIIQCLDLVLSQREGTAKLLIENQAGDHAFMGTSFEELVNIRSLSRHPDKIGFCLDTCHLFASGVWNGSNGEEWAAKARLLGYFDALTAVHANDSVYASGRKRDRHAAIGRGEIGEAGFRWLLSVPEIRTVPLVLETPETADASHAEQIRLLAEWADREGFQ